MIQYSEFFLDANIFASSDSTKVLNDNTANVLKNNGTNKEYKTKKSSIKKAKIRASKQLFIKTCSKCYSLLNSDYFGADINNKDQKKDICKKCFSELSPKEKQSYQRKYISRYVNRYNKRRRSKDKNFDILMRERSRLSILLQSGNTSDNFNKHYSCTNLKLREHFEAQFRDGMNWSNYGKLWEVDHVLPAKEYILTNKEELTACFHFDNLQPLTIAENKEKYTNYVLPKYGGQARFLRLSLQLVSLISNRS